MKKIFIAIAAVAAMTFASCGNQTAQGEGTDSVAIDTTVVEETGVAEAQTEAEAVVAGLAEQLNANNAEGLAQKVEAAKAYVQELVNSGKLEAAKVYAEKIQAFVDENKEKLDAITSGNSTISELISTVTALPSSASEAVSGAAESAEGAANSAVDAAKSAVESGKSAVNDAKDAAKAKANEVVNEAKTAAENKANEAVNDAKAKTNEAIDKAANEAKKKLGF